MTEDERYQTVAACKYVTKVIKDAPMVYSEKFINDNNIQVYAIGEEYAQDVNDHYYMAARNLGIIRAT